MEWFEFWKGFIYKGATPTVSPGPDPAPGHSPGLWSVVAFCLQTDQQLDSALDLMRRLPPQQIEKNLSDLIDLVSLLP